MGTNEIRAPLLNGQEAMDFIIPDQNYRLITRNQGDKIMNPGQPVAEAEVHRPTPPRPVRIIRKRKIIRHPLPAITNRMASVIIPEQCRVLPPDPPATQEQDTPDQGHKTPDNGNNHHDRKRG